MKEIIYLWREEDRSRFWLLRSTGKTLIGTYDGNSLVFYKAEGEVDRLRTRVSGVTPLTQREVQGLVGAMELVYETNKFPQVLDLEKDVELVHLLASGSSEVFERNDIRIFSANLFIPD